MTLTGVRRLVVLSLLAVGGCGGSESGFPKTYPVTGVVKVDGKPVEGAIVTFQLENAQGNAIGNTDAKGEFSLSTYRPNDGAVAGQYRVAITKPAEGGTAAGDTPPPGQIASADLPSDYAPPAKPAANGGAKKNEVPSKYANDQTSGLRATVATSGKNYFEFDLK